MLKFDFIAIILIVSLLVFTTVAETYDDVDDSSSNESSTDEEDSSEPNCVCNTTQPICPQNEVYSNCSNGLCQLKLCTQYGSPKPYCLRFNVSNCKGGCICQNKYLRNPQGVCVPQEQCPKYLCKDNEVYSNCTNGGCDARNCSQLGSPVPCVKLDPADCIRGCVCVKGFLRSKNGTCIPSENCPIVCKTNEVYSNCTNGGCQAKRCSQLGYQIPCVDYNSASCIKGCACIDDYVRNDKGVCIPIDQCPSCGGDVNAMRGCGNCGRHCSNYKIKKPRCPRIPCYINDCKCKPAYVYDDNIQKCVLPKDCTPECGIFEIYSNCSRIGCQPKKCSEVGLPIPCDPKTCVKGCICIQDYLRADNGTCIPANQCPPRCGQNEVYSNCSNGVCRLKFCTQYGNPLPFCPRFNISNCKGGCICKNRYLRNPEGLCVPQEQCPKYLCSKNEEYSTCTNGGCDARNCSQLGSPVPCVKLDPANCKKGCVCVKGYLRADNGTCIPSDKCPPKCGRNEVYSNCSNGMCRFKFCTQYGNPLPFCPRFNISNCKGGCICKNKYLRNPEGLCVPQEQCPKYLCSKNEEYSTCTNGGCDARNCSQLGSPVPCVKLDPANCKKGCVCVKGYLRADNGTCIPSDKCPPKCGRNEVYSNCSNGICRLKFCTQYGSPLPFCPRFNMSNCKGGCICKNKYLRNPQGVCVPQEQCPIYLCTGKEVYSTCTNGGCEARNCSQLGSPVPCVKLDPASCKRGCVCVEGYLRADNGTCIPKAKCPSGKNNNPCRTED
ncbi:unnamed protein product [Chilo suppressalis]|uniref:TIL domain-containing protein n=1 Tax=Chilo suppressalis TaxID=168631 RepID=A0ABN8LDD6_CHISP|nr:unnamed protein product [Chilo suppressalis]